MKAIRIYGFGGPEVLSFGEGRQAAPVVKNCVFHQSEEKWNAPTRRPAISPTTIRQARPISIIA